jgi:hypothetical protein
MRFRISSIAVVVLCVLGGCQSIDSTDVPAEIDSTDVPAEEERAGEEAEQAYVVSPDPAQVTEIPEDFGSLEDAGFAKFTTVFDVPVVATPEVSDRTIFHVRSVLADYLDNDEDGVADNPRVVFALQRSNAVAAVFVTFDEHEVWDSRDGGGTAEPYNLMTMVEEETDPAYGFDASLEEVLHLVTELGFALAYPEELGETGDTGLVRALEQAQDTGDFFYDDPTCDPRCQATEYFYWAITSNMGLQEERCDEISQEWALCNPERLAERNPAFVDLLENPEFRLPTVSPDGQYEPARP